MNNVMIDIETLGNKGTPAIIQFAGVYFDPVTGENKDTMSVCLDADELQRKGFPMDASTVRWWLDQDITILKGILDAARPCGIALPQVREFLGYADVIWSHATFDFVTLQTHFQAFGIKPLPYKASRDIRTLVSLSGINLYSYDWSKKTHDALDDCRFQIRYCVDAMNKLKGTDGAGRKNESISERTS